MQRLAYWPTTSVATVTVGCWRKVEVPNLQSCSKTRLFFSQREMNTERKALDFSTEISAFSSL